LNRQTSAKNPALVIRNASTASVESRSRIDGLISKPIVRFRVSQSGVPQSGSRRTRRPRDPGLSDFSLRHALGLFPRPRARVAEETHTEQLQIVAGDFKRV